VRLFIHYWFVIVLPSCPELFYFGTNQSGTAKKNLSDLFPFTSDSIAAFGCRKIARLETALRQAEERC
jgi:hypothetical protein